MLHKADIQVTYDMKRFVLRIEEDDYGENYIHIPDDVMRECGWDIGTVLEYEEETDGSVILHKVEE
jgi:hypothetical protein|tara:strand:- start:938 stop:1135 length:198 start_codon:yes stop_codon:yes gene_type:complete